MVTMFSRSISKHNLRYTSYIADGDTKNDTNISQSKPYGDLPLVRYQYVNHFAKRMKTRLMTIKKNYGRTHLDDNKTIGGKGRLGMIFSKST
jgi:Mutator-like transposase